MVKAAFVVREGSMTDLHETNPKRTAQIDTIGWFILSQCSRQERATEAVNHWAAADSVL